ncbi:MAG: 3-oxoacyl-[acyl-carrier-protein] synthase III C-terminal domain-containing protein [Pseudomonadota bacterium]
MVGIVSYGAYVPLHRLGLGTRGWMAQTEKAVASWDEDSLTMAVAAALDCIGNGDRNQIDGLYFASTTTPYREKLAATTLGLAADLRTDMLTADITDTLRSGTSAFRMAADTVKAGSAKRVLVTASDRRLGVGGLDQDFGDGAAAFIIGDTDVAATLLDSYSISNELLDVWRAEGSRRTRTWEDRWVFEEGYQKVVPDAISRFLKKAGVNMADLSKVVLYAPDARRHREMAARLKLQPAQVQNPFFDKMGNTGAAFSLMQLVAALEDAKPGDKIMCVSYGDGADILLFQATDKIGQVKPKWGMKRGLASKMMVTGMDQQAAFQNVAATDPERGGSASASEIARERDCIYRMHGVKCKNCGTIQFPPQRVCTSCHQKDNFDSIRMSDKKAKVFLFVIKPDVPAYMRPGIDTMVDFEGGGRAIFGMTDISLPAKVESKDLIGSEVEMSFRKLGVGGQVHNYFWRCKPLRETWLTPVAAPAQAKEAK